MRHLAAAALLLAHAGSAPAQAPTVRGARSATVASGAREVTTPMRDQVKLAGNLYLPASGTAPFPCVVQRTPYGKDAMFADPALARRYTDSGYAYLVQDVRGKGRSEGFYQAFLTDAQDGYDTIEWMAAQPWCNGRVGITGGSAMGIAANLAATTNPPHLKAAFVVVAPSSRLTGSFIGGAFKQKDSGDWSRGQGIPEETIARNAANYPDNAGYSSDIAPNRRFITVPMYNYGGWYDIFNEGNVRNFTFLQTQGADGARGNQKLEMGPFGHGPLSGDLDYGPDAGRMRANPQEIRWFDHWLKGIENGIMAEPPVRAFMMASARKGALSPKNRWVRFGSWPPAPAERAWYLHADGTLSQQPPGAADRPRTYAFDPKKPVPTIGGANLTFDRGPMDQRPIGRRPDYLRFQTAPLAADVAIAGPVAMDLWAATDGPDTDFTVKLVDVYPDGYEALVLDTALRTRYRDGRGPGEVKPMVPGAPARLALDLWDTAITFEKGHRIAVHVSSSNSPRIDVNPNTGGDPGPGVGGRVARNTVFLDAAHPSAIRLPVVFPGP